MSEKKTRMVNCRLMVIVGSLTLLFVIVIFSIVGFNVKRVSRVSKRSILAICDMIHTYTNRSCTDFNQYGCFCGIGSHGSKPLDAIDRCCYDHDLCYGSFHCHWFYYPFVPYDYSCNSDYCMCTSNPKMCGSIICECDIQLSECFAHNIHLYNQRLKNIDENKCWRRMTQDSAFLQDWVEK